MYTVGLEKGSIDLNPTRVIITELEEKTSYTYKDLETEFR